MAQVITPSGLNKAAPTSSPSGTTVSSSPPAPGFSDNHLVTKKYVDDNAGGFTPGEQVAKLNSTAGVQVGGFYISNGNVYCKVS